MLQKAAIYCVCTHVHMYARVCVHAHAKPIAGSQFMEVVLSDLEVEPIS